MNIEETRNAVVNLSGNMLIEESLHATEQTNSRLECFSLSEVANHGDASDCWIIIYDRVYRITDFLDKVRHFWFAAIIDSCELFLNVFLST